MRVQPEQAEGQLVQEQVQDLATLAAVAASSATLLRETVR
jgi:hypothetical protein